MPFLRTLLLTLLLLGAAALPAQAQIREGMYAVEGQNPDGSTYQGQFLLQPGPQGAWIAMWQVGEIRLVGLGVIQGGVLAISFGVEGRPGIAAYEVQADGKLRGSWSTGGGLGTESLTPQ
jgi:hypothetical protein